MELTVSEREDIKMFKVKLSFDTDRLEQDILEQLYNKVDEIFESEDLNCVDRALVRVYEDKTFPLPDNFFDDYEGESQCSK